MTRTIRPMGGASLPERLARWAVGLPMTGLRYMLHRVPFYQRDDRDVDSSENSLPDGSRALPGDPDTLQRRDDGVGPLYHRSYTIYVTDEEMGPEELIDRMLEDPNRLTPMRIARFETPGDEFARDLVVGDELVVRLPGPWDGPVRVIERTPTSFRLATLKGHMEAGEIEFSTGYDDRGFLRFRIQSWARSGDGLFHLLYDRFFLGREMQLHLWSQFCRRVAATSGGVQMSNVVSSTRRLS